MVCRVDLTASRYSGGDGAASAARIETKNPTDRCWLKYPWTFLSCFSLDFLFIFLFSIIMWMRRYFGFFLLCLVCVRRNAWDDTSWGLVCLPNKIWSWVAAAACTEACTILRHQLACWSRTTMKYIELCHKGSLRVVVVGARAAPTTTSTKPAKMCVGVSCREQPKEQAKWAVTNDDEVGLRRLVDGITGAKTDVSVRVQWCQRDSDHDTAHCHRHRRRPPPTTWKVSVGAWNANHNH